MSSPVSRRDAIRNTLLLGAAALTPGLIALGCGKKELACTDTAGLEPQDVQMRTQLEYIDKAADPAKECDKCQLYKPGAPDACGGCTLLKGPINPKGYCKSWVPKQPA